MKEPMVADLGRYENESITGFFCVAQKSVRNKKDGAPYLALTLADSSGQIECRMWDAGEASEFVQGDVVKIRGQVSRYKEQLQITADRLRKAAAGEYSVADFVPATERDVDEMWAELEEWVSTMKDADFARLARTFLDDADIRSALQEAPAAKALHHAWIGGLLEHILSLMGVADAVVRRYPGANRDLLLTGVLLHDIGKLKELRWATSFEYTLPGQLLGHITIGVRMVEEKIAVLGDFPEEKRVLVEHMILSHHGRYEFGSPKLPMIPEAILLHYLDDMDAKMQTMQVEFARAATNGRDAADMTDWVRSMERPVLNTAAYLKTSVVEERTEENEAIPNGLPFED
ncbi:MAG: 3'-5' exoribonuclease YhaM family protein [Acidobacteriaceae bacterium]